MAATYQPRIRLPAFLARGRANVSELPVYVDGTLTAPDSGTYTLTRPDGTAAVDAQSATVTASVATYSVTPASTEALGEGWLETWSLVFSGTTYVFTRQSACVRDAPVREIGPVDMRARHPELGNQDTDVSEDEDACDEAWVSVQRWLIAKGRRPYLVIPSGALSEPTLLRALAMRFRNLSTFAGGSRYAEMAAYYDEAYAAEMERLVLTYDMDEDGMPDGDETTTPARSVLYLHDPPRRFRVD